MQCHRYTHAMCKVSHYISFSVINDAVLKKLEEDLWDVDLEISVNSNKKEETNHMSSMLLKMEYKKLERVKAAYEAGVDTLEEYREKKQLIQTRIKELEADLQTEEMPREEVAKVFKSRVRSALPKLYSEDVSEIDKNELLKSFISKIIFDRKGTEKTIQIFYYI